MDSIQSYGLCGMGSNPIELTILTCGVMAAFKTLTLEVMVQIHSGYQKKCL